MDIVFSTVNVVASHPKTGASVPIVHGSHWPADDPVVLAYPNFFSSDGRFGLSSSRPLDADGYPLGHVEQATAAPGEKRTRARAQ
jgi:hypothetical protein